MGSELCAENHAEPTEEEVLRALSAKAQEARRAVRQAKRLVLVTKFRFLGDTIVATPLLEPLRRLAPNAAITLITSPPAAIALAHCPHIDHLIPIEMRGKSRWRHSRELLGILREGRYTAAFLLNRSIHCALIGALACIPHRIGYDSERRGFLLTLPIPYRFDRREANCHLDMVRALGVTAEETLPALWFTEEERQRARNILIEQGATGNEPLLIGIQPGANKPEVREWGAERFARVADALAARTGGRVVLFGGAAEQATALATERALRHPPINLVGKLALRDSLSAIGLCGLWVGNDTGLLHAAVAQRVPSVGLFAPNRVARWVSSFDSETGPTSSDRGRNVAGYDVTRWGYHTPRHRSLVVFPDNPNAGRDPCTLRRYLDAITEEQVLATACEALEAK